MWNTSIIRTLGHDKNPRNQEKNITFLEVGNKAIINMVLQALLNPGTTNEISNMLKNAEHMNVEHYMGV